MNLTRGSILNMTADRGTVSFKDEDGEIFKLPLIGWATVINWSSSDPDCHVADDEQHTHETGIEPVILIPEEGAPITVRDYLRDPLFKARLHRIELDR